jgi:hypothetical protein
MTWSEGSKLSRHVPEQLAFGSQLTFFFLFQSRLPGLALPDRILLGREPQRNLGTGSAERWQEPGTM